MTEPDSLNLEQIAATNFDKSAIPADLYKSNPEEARTRVLEGLQTQQEMLQRTLLEQNVDQGFIDEARAISEKFATEAMRADQLIAEHPEYTDVAMAFYRDAFSRGAVSDEDVVNQAKDSVARRIPENDAKRHEIDHTMRAYQGAVEESVAIRLARPEDLGYMMSDRANTPFPNIRKHQLQRYELRQSSTTSPQSPSTVK